MKREIAYFDNTKYMSHS